MSTSESTVRVAVGLGNPGRKYEGTRHNVGFDVLRELQRRSGSDRPRTKFEAELTETNWLGAKLLLLAPQTYMNLSGRSVRALADFYHLEPSQFLVICDDLNLPLGKLRVRKSGSAGGQKGLADIVRQMSTDAIPRLRLGIGSPPGGMDAVDFVLGKFASDEEAMIATAVRSAADAVETWVKFGIDAAMNRFNAEGGSGETGETKTGDTKKPPADSSGKK